MRTLSNIFDTIVSYDNLLDAHKKASQGKSHYREVKMVNSNLDFYLKQIQQSLISGTFKTSTYEVETCIKGRKERTIHKLPYYPDRIVHHALVRVCKDFWVKSMIRDTFQSIEKRGTLDCFKRVKRVVTVDRPRYAVKIDVRKFYPSVQTELLLKMNPFKITDPKAFALLSEILSSLPFLPLGNHTSQFAGNLFLTPFDWHCKQVLQIKHYFRYCDDIVVMGNDKQNLLSQVLAMSEQFNELGLNIKQDYVIIDLSNTPLDFVGYRFMHDKILLRKTLKQDFITACKAKKVTSMPSYFGWCKHGNCYNLFNNNTRFKNAHTSKRKTA